MTFWQFSTADDLRGDWLFPTEGSRQIIHALNATGASVSSAVIETDKGHDAFLLDEPELFAITRGFLGAAARARGIPETTPHG